MVAICELNHNFTTSVIDKRDFYEKDFLYVTFNKECFRIVPKIIKTINKESVYLFFQIMTENDDKIKLNNALQILLEETTGMSISDILSTVAFLK